MNFDACFSCKMRQINIEFCLKIWEIRILSDAILGIGKLHNFEFVDFILPTNIKISTKFGLTAQGNRVNLESNRNVSVLRTRENNTISGAERKSNCCKLYKITAILREHMAC